MCDGLDHSLYVENGSFSSGDGSSTLFFESSVLLELAADNDLWGFKEATTGSKARIDMIGSWYCRRIGTKQMILDQMTPVMIAALHGSVDVLEYMLTTYTYIGGDINKGQGTDGSTALHCGAAGGSIRALEVVRLLLNHGADPDVVDAHGRRPADVIARFPSPADTDISLQMALKATENLPVVNDCSDGQGVDSPSLVSALSSLSNSPMKSQSDTPKPCEEGNVKTKDNAMGPNIPDAKNSFYSSDEFRMFSCKVRPCSRAYSHDWTECPFVHPGENARRRDPRKYHYSCVPCPDFRKGACKLGDACEYSHGVFECWLHPAQYRTRLCKDGTACTRRVCFFAHTQEELRPLYVSADSVILSRKASLSYDVGAVSPPLDPESPPSVSSPSVLTVNSSVSANSVQGSLLAPPVSPTSQSVSSGSRLQSNMQTLQLPGANLQTSRLRAAVSARNLTIEDLDERVDFCGGQTLKEYATPLSSQALSNQARVNAAFGASANGILSAYADKYTSLGLGPTNLNEIFETAYSDSDIKMQKPQYQVQPQTTSVLLSKVLEELQLKHALLKSSLQKPASSKCFKQLSSFEGMDVEHHGPRLSPSALIAARAAFALHDKKSHSFKDLGAGLKWSDWASATGKVEWGVEGNDLLKLRKSSSFGYMRPAEPDFADVQKLLKETTLR